MSVLISDLVPTSAGAFSNADEADWAIERLSARDIAAAHVYGPVRGPLYPFESFKEEEKKVIMEAVADKRLVAYNIYGADFFSQSALKGIFHFCVLNETWFRPWVQDLDAVVSFIEEMEHLPSESPKTMDPVPLYVDDLPGPIIPIEAFSGDKQQVLHWCINKGRIRAMKLGGRNYVSYVDVNQRSLDAYFEHSLGSPGAWDGTYSHRSWDHTAFNKGYYAKPLGYEKPLLIENSRFLKVWRRRYYNETPDGFVSQKIAPYPEHIAYQAAKQFRELYQQDGYKDRVAFGLSLIEDSFPEGDILEPLDQYPAYELNLIAEFIADGVVACHTYDGRSYIAIGNLLHYERFASGIFEDELLVSLSTPTEVELQDNGELHPCSEFDAFTKNFDRRQLGASRPAILVKPW